VSRVDDLRADYDALGDKLVGSSPGEAAAIVRERRILGELLYALEKPEEVTKVDELAARRTKPETARVSRRRNKSG
jgi:predicted ATPase